MLQPKKRLPGFDGEWTTKNIGSFLKVRHGKNQSHVIDSNGEYPILASGGEIGRTNSYLYNKPSVLLGRKGTIDKPRYMETPFWTVDTLFFTEIYESASPRYVFHLFNTINWRSHNEGSGVPSLNSATIENLKVCVPPSLEEQTAIADCLSTWDSAIQSIDKRIVNAKQQKAALAQRLLSGEERLPGFEGEWEDALLKKYARKVSTKNKDGAINIVLTNSATLGIVNQRDYFEKDIANKSNLSGYYVVDTDDFVYNPRI